MDVLNYFSTNEWMFTNEQFHGVMAKLSNDDRDHFYCDVRDINWDNYFEEYIRGIRIYLIKDPLDTLPQARVRWQRYEIVAANPAMLLANLMPPLLCSDSESNVIFFVASCRNASLKNRWYTILRNPSCCQKCHTGFLN